jgi:BASS family bile acid:Na+ symporter
MKIKDYFYSITIILLVIIGYNFSEYFIQWGQFKLSGFIKPFLQIIMLGMGATMTPADFIEVFKSPHKVGIGLFLQFTIMPLLGLLLTILFQFPAEIAAGIILIGCSPSGLASNVITLMAKANVALSITLTTIATLLAPILTPLLMKLLGGSLIEVQFWNMFWDMLQLVLFPIFAGLILNKLFPNILKLILPYLPQVSMVGIGYIVLVVTANGSSSLQSVGVKLIFAMLIHNMMGYTLGYFSSKILKMNESDCRTIAIEVGMQNAGLASALANEMGKVATIGLAPAIFGPLMNVSGSVLANFWGNKKKT